MSTYFPSDNKTLRAWRAGRVARWHTNPLMSGSGDFNDAHSLRVAVLALQLKPDLSREAVIHAIGHDLGEHAVGDISWDAKQQLPKDIMDAIDDVELSARASLGFARVDKNDHDIRIVKLCDWLDAWAWMMHVQPRLGRRKDWVDQRRLCQTIANDLLVGREVEQFIDAVRHETGDL